MKKTIVILAAAAVAVCACNKPYNRTEYFDDAHFAAMQEILDNPTTQNETYTRLGSMKHLEQLLGTNFVRVTPKLLLPLKHIHSCRNGIVIMKKMPFEEEGQLRAIDSKNKEEIANDISQNLLRLNGEESKASVEQTARKRGKRKSVVPPKEKLVKIQACIHKNPGIKSADIAAKTGFSSATVERSLAVLKQRGLITHSGSNKTGGYYAVE